jgi:sugar-specific transcriptional regulator TrmB
MEQILENIQKLGLEEKMARVYLAALELGVATVNELSDKSNVKRTSIYNFLNEMKQMQLLEEVDTKNKTMLRACNPDVLIKQAEEQLKSLKAAVPFLADIYNQPANNTKVRFFLGMDSLKNLHKEVCSRSEPIYGYTDYDKMLSTMDENYMWGIIDKRAELNIPYFCIAKDGPMARVAKNRDKEQKRVIKLVKGGAFETEINIYGKWVAITSFHRPCAGVIVEDFAIAKTMKAIWQMLWNKLE